MWVASYDWRLKSFLLNVLQEKFLPQNVLLAIQVEPKYWNLCYWAAQAHVAFMYGLFILIIVDFNYPRNPLPDFLSPPIWFLMLYNLQSTNLVVQYFLQRIVLLGMPFLRVFVLRSRKLFYCRFRWNLSLKLFLFILFSVWYWILCWKFILFFWKLCMLFLTFGCFVPDSMYSWSCTLFYPFQLLKNPADWWLLAVFHFWIFSYGYHNLNALSFVLLITIISIFWGIQSVSSENHSLWFKWNQNCCVQSLRWRCTLSIFHISEWTGIGLLLYWFCSHDFHIVFSISTFCAWDHLDFQALNGVVCYWI